MPGVSGAFRLHSRYDPEKEASRYIEAQQFSFEPVYIVVTEPGESYLASVLRNRFPKAYLVCLRYQTVEFRSSDPLWDSVWRPDCVVDVASFLFNLIPDEYLPQTVFLPWKPSDSQWPAVSALVWDNIASMIRLQTSVMYTRTRFGLRWLKNCIKNITLARTLVHPMHTNRPVFLAASGPSLEKQFPFSLSSFYVCAVSSALSCLDANGCKPDLCIATDGGYWAMNHFRRISPQITVAFPPEAAIPSSVLESNPILFLDYGSELEKALFKIAGCVPEKASRNGTVSGTAALFLLEHTSSSVYAAGLDLQSSASFSHARPHATGPATDALCGRKKPLSTILYAGSLDTASLEMYASWFEHQARAFRNRFFRLTPCGREIPGIETVDVEKIPYGNSDAVLSPVMQESIPRSIRKERLLAWLESLRAKFTACSQSMLQEPLYKEILQMVSYTDYIRFLKNGNGFDDLCRKAALCMERLASMVTRFGDLS